MLGPHVCSSARDVNNPAFREIIIIDTVTVKMNALEWPQDFPHYNPLIAICCHGNQSSDPVWPKNLMQSFSHPNDASDTRWL